MLLFEIGVMLGSFLVFLLYLLIFFLVGLGFIGVFFGVMNMLIVCFIMGIELFGSEVVVYFFMVCLISFMCLGNSGIYVL